MAAHFPHLEPAHRDFISHQKIFFNASAAETGRVNVSPRDAASLRVLDEHTVAYLDLTGSGNETSAHVRATGRLTLMFCAMHGAPLILRLYGRGEILRRGSPQYRELLTTHFADHEPPGARQIVMLKIDAVQTSCGYNVPLFDYVKERDTLIRWAAKKGDEALEAYRQEKNVRSIDGFPTGWPEK